MNAKIKKRNSTFTLGILLLIVGIGWLFFELDMLEKVTFKFIFAPILFSIYFLATAFNNKSTVRAFFGSAALLFAIFQIFTKIDIELESIQGEVLILIFGFALAFSSIFKKKKSNLLFFATGIVLFAVCNFLHGIGSISDSTLIFIQKLWPLILVALGIKILLSKPIIHFNSFNDSTSESINFDFGSSSGSGKSKSSVRMDFDFGSSKNSEEAEIDDILEEKKIESVESAEGKNEVIIVKNESNDELKKSNEDIKEETVFDETEEKVKTVVEELEAELLEESQLEKAKEPTKPKKPKKDKNLDDKTD